MNKSDLVALVAGKASVSKKVSEAVINATLSTIEETLKNGEKIVLVGFGSFETRERAARIGRNPKTKEEVTIAASKAPVFKAGKSLKNSING